MQKKKQKKKVIKKAKPKKVKSKVKRPKGKTIKTKKITKPGKKPAKKGAISVGTSLQEIGVVTHYFSQVSAAVVKLTKGSLSLGDNIIIKGVTTELQEKVKSIQIDRVPITNASIGQEIGLKVKSKVREHDIVYKIVT